MAEEKQPALFPSMAFSVWPPSQKIRSAVIQRIVETLSNPSVLSKRFGVMDVEEASSTARIIEDQAFLAASSSRSLESGAGGPVGLGIEALQLYSKEISQLIIDAVKARASPDENPQSPPPADAAVITSSEDNSRPSSALYE
ncbi:MFP1 attachment factor 1 [Nymphaea thermarum]|nr:MFP1 attachment factor 1 [Nymphaea thermarum]